MAQRMFHESGEDGRSVLGMLAVQVERDPKTGATVVRSVSPVSAPAGVPKATTVFDDGRKSIHAVGGPVGQPSPEELGQILNVIDGVGMKVLLDEVRVEPKAEEIKSDAAEDNSDAEERVPPFADMSEEDDGDNEQSDSSISDHDEAELTIQKCAVEEGNTDDETLMVVQADAERVEHIEDQRLEEGPVTLMFLGYTDATTGQENQEGEITVERVLITEDGEEHVLGPEASAPLPSPLEQVVEEDAEKEDEVLQEIPLDENGAGVKVQAEEGDAKLDISPSPSKTEGDDIPKRKTCQCCSVIAYCCHLLRPYSGEELPPLHSTKERDISSVVGLSQQLELTDYENPLLPPGGQTGEFQHSPQSFCLKTAGLAVGTQKGK